jgi:hypothetical protein
MAPVQAAATFSAMADDALYYNAMCSPEEVRIPESTCAAWDTVWGAYHGPAPNAESSQNSPDQMPAVYAWRDPAAFEGYQGVSGWIEKSPYAGISYQIGAPGDLQRRRDVPFLMLSGGQDTFIDVDQTCEISATLGSAASNWLLVDNHYASSTGSRLSWRVELHHPSENTSMTPPRDFSCFRWAPKLEAWATRRPRRTSATTRCTAPDCLTRGSRPR